MIEIDKNTECSFDKAYVELVNNNKIITSKNSGCSYKSDQRGRKKKVKFFNKNMDIWQASSYFDTEEILDKWYINSRE